MALALLLLLLMRFEVEEDPVSLPRFFDDDFAALALALLLCALVDDATAGDGPTSSTFSSPASPSYFLFQRIV